MNDSFLEDLELIPTDPKTSRSQVERHITTRNATSSPLLQFSEQNERDNVIRSHKIRSTVTVPNMPDIKITSSKNSTKDSKKQSDQNAKKHSTKVKVSEKNEKVEGKVDVKTRMDNNKQQAITRKSKATLQETGYLKVPENKTASKDHNQCSGSHKETTQSLGLSTNENKCSGSLNNHCLDISAKENSRPTTDSSRESGSHNSAKEKERLPNLRKSTFGVQDQDPVALLTAIKELISTYTKQESAKILHAMQELHINSQAALIKNLICQTDDLVNEMHPSKDSARVRTLIEENERLRQELFVLKLRNEDLQSKLEEFEFLKQENAALKLKCNELT